MAKSNDEPHVEYVSTSSVHLSDLPAKEVIFGRSEAMSAVRQRVERACVTSVPFLILGESGTGKELLAHLIHQISPMSAGPLIRVNCTAAPKMMLERDLFGYTEIAVTGDQRTKPGMLEQAQGGTLFLDQVGELDPYLQARLVYELQDADSMRTAGSAAMRKEFRLICSSSRDLRKETAAGRFRKDLYYRINVVTVSLPPLRARHEDIPAMVEYFQDRFAIEYGCGRPPVPGWLTEALMQHHWPGNIRELKNLIRRFVILGSDEILADELFHKHKSSETSGAAQDLSLKARTTQAVREIERKVILDALRANNWNRKEAARTLKISYRSLFNKLKMAGLPPKRGHLR